MKQITIPVPPIREQERIVEITGTVDRQIEALQTVACVHAELKRSLMHDLLTGKLRTDQLKLDDVAA